MSTVERIREVVGTTSRVAWWPRRMRCGKWIWLSAYVSMTVIVEIWTDDVTMPGIRGGVINQTRQDHMAWLLRGGICEELAQ